MPRFRRALRNLCCFSAAKDEVDAELQERLRQYHADWTQRQISKLWKKLDSKEINDEIFSQNGPKRSSRQRRMEPSKLRAADTDEEAGREIMERVEVMNQGEAKSEAQILLEKQRKEEERQNHILAIRRRTLTRRFEAEKVRKELAAVLIMEFRVRMGTVLFSQGLNGASSFTIWKGPVDVITQRKGNLTTLYKGRDPGRLDLDEGAPHANLIVRQHDCHFLRVGNTTPMTILKDVTASTFQVEEHGKLVLLLQRNSGLEMVPPNQDGPGSNSKFSVMASTPMRLLDLLLGTMDSEARGSDQIVPFMSDFLLTHLIYLPTEQLCSALLSRYQAVSMAGLEGARAAVALDNRRGIIIRLVVEWAELYGPLLMGDPTVTNFLKKLKSEVQTAPRLFTMFKQLMMGKKERMYANGFRPQFKRHDPDWFLRYDDNPCVRIRPIRALDEVAHQVFLPDHTSVHLKMAAKASVRDVISALMTMVGAGGDDEGGGGRGHVLVKMDSSGERAQLLMEARGVATSLELNEKLFLCPPELMGKLTPVKEQLGPVSGSMVCLESESPEDTARQMTAYDWELLTAVHQSELLFFVTGQEGHPLFTTANLDRFLRRFDQVQCWVTTEICLCNDLANRAALITKFIKIATVLREMRNLHSFSAVLFGLMNRAVMRLHGTWEKVPKKWMGMFKGHVKLMNPHRNYRVYREALADLSPPYIPLTQLLLKDMTVIHEGSGNYTDGLINFAKMRMIAKILRVLTHCRSQSYFLSSFQEPWKAGMSLSNPPRRILCTPPPPRYNSLRRYVENVQVISDQRKLMELAEHLEPWCTMGDYS